MLLSVPRIAALLLPLALIAGCAGGESHKMLGIAQAQPQEIAATHSILVVTTREAATDRSEVFSGARGDGLSFARVDVTVPAVHEKGRLEKPRSGQKRDAAQHFAASEIALFPRQQGFATTLRERIARTGGRALVFVHGYRTPFDGSVYRTAQIVHDSGYTGTPVLFSWASTGRTVDYIYDNNSATVARDGLEKTLRMLRENGATRIDIIAHSMGNWLTMEALRQTAIGDGREVMSKLGDVILASPDVDIDVFKSQIQRIGKQNNQFVVLVSRDDRALQVSSIIAGNRPRVGDYDKDGDLAALGVTVVDISGLSSGDRLNHARFADNPVFIQLLGQRLNDGNDFGDENIISQRIGGLTRGIGQTIGSAAEIIITTPFEVMSVVVRQ
ncbi:alpha/beta hydrolase [Aerobium aerolatum]|uniref:Esterase/lipase superfamily enzyme n=1 Tax=Aquamicrobium aerolatum DSM 21857 TaxID=1121003 RepID=A0A1I3RM33_9HYPH|nr:alpha/beta hydrolase [Aquamicrobium aerolatum]SFJ47080.1 Esterase/lipase superfamily enzyme [Aquamicrobium aerolatum DSM 21857]